MKIIVCPLHEVEAAIQTCRPSHVISMASPDAELASLPGDVEQLRLRFHDIAEPREGLTAASVDDVDRLLTFARGWPRSAPLLIQCWAGVSRSPAAAYIIACALAGPGRERDLALGLRIAAPFATPNPLMIALADEALGRGAAMVREIAAIGRGEETSMGRVFEMPLAG